jgi:hypothetical protein
MKELFDLIENYLNKPNNNNESAMKNKMASYN